MNLPQFLPSVDVPLAVAVYTLSVFATVVWLRRSSSRKDRLIKVTESQIAARILVVVLSLLIPCYLIDFAFWGVFALIAALFTFGLLLGGEPGGILAGPVMLAALFVREFVLGFPDLVLHPEAVCPSGKPESLIDPLVGQRAVTVSALRPSGTILHEGRILQAASEAGTFIDPDVTVSIRHFRNGICWVEIADESSDPASINQ
jgi:membrane-bound ClpP family serine protease